MENWLTVDEMCQELRLTQRVVLRLVRDHKLVGVQLNHLTIKQWRLLDPSEEYKRALAAQETILGRSYAIDLMKFPIIGTAELAALSGMSQEAIRGFVSRGILKPHKMGKFSVYTPDQVRAFLMRRDNREPTKRRARCNLLVRWCLKMLKEHPEATLTSEQVREDDELEGTLRQIMRQKEPERTKNLAEFWRRFELAQSVGKILSKFNEVEERGQVNQ